VLVGVVGLEPTLMLVKNQVKCGFAQENEDSSGSERKQNSLSFV
jgi:hypothetical protein